MARGDIVSPGQASGAAPAAVKRKPAARPAGSAAPTSRGLIVTQGGKSTVVRVPADRAGS